MLDEKTDRWVRLAIVLAVLLVTPLTRAHDKTVDEHLSSAETSVYVSLGFLQDGKLETARLLLRKAETSIELAEAGGAAPTQWKPVMATAALMQAFVYAYEGQYQLAQAQLVRAEAACSEVECKPAWARGIRALRQTLKFASSRPSEGRIHDVRSLLEAQLPKG